MSQTRSPMRGEIWFVDLDPVVGHEQAGRRPVLVVSSNYLNTPKRRISIVVPLTTTDRQIPIHVVIEPPEGGLRLRSVALVEQLRCASWDRFQFRIGQVSSAKFNEVQASLREILDL